MNIVILFILWVKSLIVGFWHFLLNSLNTSFWIFIIFGVQLTTIFLNFILNFFEVLRYLFTWRLTSVNSLLTISLKPLLRVTLIHWIFNFRLATLIKILDCFWALFFMFELVFLNEILINLFCISLLFFKVFLLPFVLFLFPNIQRSSSCWLNCPNLVSSKILQTFCDSWVNLKPIFVDLLTNKSKSIACFGFYLISCTVWSCQSNVLNHLCYNTLQ